MKNKILPLFLIFTLFSALFVNFSYAYVSYIEDDVLENIVDYCKNTDYYQSGDYYLVVAPTRSTYTNTNCPYAVVLLPKYTDDSFNYYYLKESSTNNTYCCTINNTPTIVPIDFPYYFFDMNGDLFSGSKVHSANNFILGNVSGTAYFYSDVDIYTDYTCTEIFFQRTPTSLVEVLEVVAPAKIFQTMMSGMIPYLIVFVIGLVAFWKAWQLLLKELRRA